MVIENKAADEPEPQIQGSRRAAANKRLLRETVGFNLTWELNL